MSSVLVAPIHSVSQTSLMIRSRVTARPASAMSSASRSNSFGPQRQLAVVAPCAPRRQIDGQLAGAQRRGGLGGLGGGEAPQVGADARQQLRQPERLDEVVVGAGVEPGHDVELAGRGR